MAYRPRYTIVYDGCSFHVTWRCHNRDWLLGTKWAKRLYYGLLLQYKDKYGIQFHSYQLMENHPHLIGTMASRERFSAFFQVVNNVFARKYNRRKKRRGQVVMDRFKSPRIQPAFLTIFLLRRRISPCLLRHARKKCSVYVQYTSALFPSRSL